MNLISLWTYLRKNNYIKRILKDYYYIYSLEERHDRYCKFSEEELIFLVLEKLKAKNSLLDLSAYKPKEKDLKIIGEAFKKAGETKISPVYEILGGKYSYEELRLARLFL